MFLGRNAGLGLSSAKELSSLSNKQLGLTDSSQARLAETKANKSAVLKDRVLWSQQFAVFFHLLGLPLLLSVSLHTWTYSAIMLTWSSSPINSPS